VAKRDRYLDLGYYEHAPTTRLDYRNGYYFRDLVTKFGVLCRLKIPRTRGRERAGSLLRPGFSQVRGRARGNSIVLFKTRLTREICCLDKD
jgi:transposase-like protein